MFKQLSLFPENIEGEKKQFQANIQKSGFNYEEIDIGDITFKAGQIEPIHRWYRLTPSYSPDLVKFLIQKLKITEKDYVLDPFSGRGTTSIQCQKQGIKSLGIEINPLLQQVGQKSLIWERENLNLLDDYLLEIYSIINEFKTLSLGSIINQFNTNIPIIHNVFRWWKQDVLKELIICREVMLKQKYSLVKNYLWIALTEACLNCANIHRNHPTITFDDNHNRKINVFEEISQRLEIIKTDLINLDCQIKSFSELGEIKLGNSTKNLQHQISRPINFVITSPPYPNRYSYVHQTRPQLHFMEVLDNIKQATEIDLQAIGGTWGKATSILQKQLIEVPHEILPYLSYYEELRDKSILMCNYATKYFIDRYISSHTYTT